MDYFTKIHQLVGKEQIILSGAVGAVVKDGKILLVQRHNLSRPWGVPGGVQELGETIRESEVADWGFFTPEEMPENMMPCCGQIVIDWASYQGKTIFR